MNDMLIDFSILVPALVAGLLVAISHVPLGQQVLSRGIVFIDLAIAQVAALGVIVASSFELPIEGWGAQISAGAAALAGALLLTWTERKRPEVQEALIGILFVLASAAMPLAQVATRVGYQTQAHFTGVFHREVGVTPRSYRLLSTVATPADTFSEETSAV